MLSVAACIGQSKWAYFSAKARRLADVDIMEAAARGPLGSIMMLSRIPWGVATLGAVVTVLALGVDTFAQQVISTEAVPEWADDGTAAFGLARDYFGGALGAPRSWSRSYWTTDRMQGAILKAFYELEIPPSFGCGTNCSWDQSHVSLGFSTSCINVTKATYATMNCTSNDLGGSRNCTMTTPGNVTFDTTIHPTFWSTVLVIKAKALYSNFPEISTPFERLPSKFIRLAAFRQPSEYRYSDGTVEQTLECDVGFAAYNYTKASSTTNKFTIESMETIPLDDGYLHINGSEPLGTSSTDSLELFSYILFNTTGLPEFHVRTLDVGALVDYFVSPSFSGTLADGEWVPVYPAGITEAIRDPHKNVSELMDSVAIAMTDQLRLNNNAIAHGLAERTTVLVRVQWAWLALPFFVVLASGLFLVAAMVESRSKSEVGLWKSSATSLLFHTVSPAEGQMRPGIPGPEQLHKIAKSTKVRLSSNRVDRCG
ncbi:hypothetical protein KVR01_011983 [Diaporthe batatas]|uniref:uncharacterized protein n=1 Tax=Diaporthe batatas TaxID=748121 RepID=UPI001D04B402|nr:uncharacterized protein KVR01_011983 [Diaporthe batatas]KAG8158222.1 hypothetical protein KVR01_011983 [Diaporthe batatas]